MPDYREQIRLIVQKKCDDSGQRLKRIEFDWTDLSSVDQKNFVVTGIRVEYEMPWKIETKGGLVK